MGSVLHGKLNFVKLKLQKVKDYNELNSVMMNRIINTSVKMEAFEEKYEGLSREN